MSSACDILTDTITLTHDAFYTLKKTLNLPFISDLSDHILLISGSVRILTIIHLDTVADTTNGKKY